MIISFLLVTSIGIAVLLIYFYRTQMHTAIHLSLSQKSRHNELTTLSTQLKKAQTRYQKLRHYSKKSTSNTQLTEWLTRHFSQFGVVIDQLTIGTSRQLHHQSIQTLQIALTGSYASLIKSCLALQQSPWLIAINQLTLIKRQTLTLNLSLEIYHY